MVTTPGHGALPSGHATQAYAAAYVLEKLLAMDSTTHAEEILQLQRQAARISTNRVVAGVHFPIDNIAGRSLGQALGEYFVERAAAPGKSHSYAFDGAEKSFAAGPVEFRPRRQPLAGTDGAGNKAPFYSQGAIPGGKVSRIGSVAKLWDLAVAEWAGRFGR